MRNFVSGTELLVLARSIHKTACSIIPHYISNTVVVVVLHACKGCI